MSRCFGFDKCRYDGNDFFCDFAEKLKKHAETIHWCPEIAIGLGCPREKIRVVRIDGKNLLFQPETGKFFTEKMIEYSDNHLKTLENIDGFFLKAKSPSCGVKNTKLFEGKSEKIIKQEPIGYEETLARAFLIARLPYEKMLDYFDSQVDYIDDWSACDTFCSAVGKMIKKHRTDFYEKKMDLIE